MTDKYLCVECNRYHIGQPEHTSVLEVVGGVLFVLFMFAAIVYAGPILLEGLR